LVINTDLLFWDEADIIQAKKAPSPTSNKGINFWCRGIDIISCFMGATHIIKAPEIIDIEAKVNMGEVRDSLSSKKMNGLQLFEPHTTHRLNRIE